ncbi:MAG: hypothetical protein WCA81_16875 [Rhizomicrobium sp.]|jgi:hypothetical protein
MSKGTMCITTRVKNGLGELLKRPGGIGREQALADADVNVESLRSEYVKAVPGEIEALETVIAGVESGEISAGEIQKLLDYADRLLVLSGTFGYPLLDAVVKSFCDLGMAMVEEKITSVAGLNVHLRAMRLVCPDAAAIDEAEGQNVLNELAKIHAHIKPVRALA